MRPLTTTINYGPDSNGRIHVAMDAAGHIVGNLGTMHGGVLDGYLTEFPGSTQMLISHGLWVYAPFRRKGISEAYDSFIKMYARFFEYRAILANVHVDNEKQRARMKKLGWEQLSKTLFIYRMEQSK